ncbi:poxin-like isoform X2 [Vanessa cardui]|uniref:poxin-like isoform X2 n=1 Tax=Vanessa cardui TaxID=171605 RepID=UPI001F13B8D4|nr:poxin-like isoform X2 [Vanessa cardui]
MFLCFLLVVIFTRSTMTKRTVLNEVYKGLVEEMHIPADLHERDGKKFASFGSVLPIHCATPEQVEQMSRNTHHYCDVFTADLLAPLDDLAFVRLDENTAEKVFLNRSKRILLVSSDGRLAQWRSAPSFESANRYVAGAPLVSRAGALASVLTARLGHHYAVSAFEGDGGYFETSRPWEILDIEEGKSYYGDKGFDTREELNRYLETLPPAEVNSNSPPRPILLRGRTPRVVLMAENGRQLAHHYLHGVLVNDVEYL